MTPFAPTLQSIDITPRNPSIVDGSTQQFIATGRYSNGSSQDLTASVVWTSSDPTVAVIISGGLAQGVADGMVIITATQGGVTGATTLIVTAAALLALAVIPGTITLQSGMTQQLGAIGLFEDSSQVDLTNSVAWSSSEPAVATVNNTGLATAVSGGTVLIQAASGDIADTATVTVWVPSETMPPPVPTDPATLLTEAQRQLFLLLTGQLPQRVENPQLGAVQFTPTSKTDLQMLIDYLQNVVAGNGTGSMTAGSSRVRKPFSFMGWP